MKIGVWQGSRQLLLKALTIAFPDGEYLIMPPECDICVSDGPLPNILHPCRCRTAVLPGDKPIDSRFLQTERVVTYGMSPENTITLSSANDGKLFLALQREILALGGKRLECQEFLIRNAAPTASTMAAASALLASGAEPVNLEHAFIE